MKAELLAQVTEITELAKNGVIQAATIVKEQLPDLVQQILAFNMALSIGGIVLATMLLVGTVKFYKWLTSEETDGGEFMVLIIGGIPSFMWLVLSIINLLKITLAPKLYLMEYIQTLVK